MVMGSFLGCEVSVSVVSEMAGDLVARRTGDFLEAGILHIAKANTDAGTWQTLDYLPHSDRLRQRLGDCAPRRALT